MKSGRLDISLSVIEGLVFITADFDDFKLDFILSSILKILHHMGYMVPIVAVDNRDNVIKALRM